MGKQTKVIASALKSNDAYVPSGRKGKEENETAPAMGLFC